MLRNWIMNQERYDVWNMYNEGRDNSPEDPDSLRRENVKLTLLVAQGMYVVLYIERSGIWLEIGKGAQARAGLDAKIEFLQQQIDRGTQLQVLDGINHDSIWK